MYNAEVLEELGKQIIDLTPAAIGPFVVPAVNVREHLVARCQFNYMRRPATIPIVHAINQVAPVEYGEIVANDRY